MDSVTHFKDFPAEPSIDHHKELIKFSMDWSLPNYRVAASLGFGYVLYTGTGKGLCLAKSPQRTATPDVPCEFVVIRKTKKWNDY